MEEREISFLYYVTALVLATGAAFLEPVSWVYQECEKAQGGSKGAQMWIKRRAVFVLRLFYVCM